MSIVKIRCASEKLRKRREVVELSIEDCLACAETRENDCQYTFELLKSMYGTIQERGDSISTTVLTSPCDRSTVMERRLDVTIDPKSLWAAFKGTMFHGQLERWAEYPAVEEARFHANFVDGNGELQNLSGSPDLYDVSRGILWDYKTTKEVPHFGYVWNNHAEQLNVNRWLIDNAHTAEWRGVEYDMGKEENIEFFVPKGWKQLAIIYMDDKRSKVIEATKSEDVPKANGNGTKKARVADIWTDEEALDFIRERYSTVHDAFAEDRIPDIPKEFEGWNHAFCNFCSTRAECIQYEYRPETVTIGRKGDS